MEKYLERKRGLACVIQLVDIRHEPTAQDVQMYEYLKHYGLSGIVVATKADKVAGMSQLQKNLASDQKETRHGEGGHSHPRLGS